MATLVDFRLLHLESVSHTTSILRAHGTAESFDGTRGTSKTSETVEPHRPGSPVRPGGLGSLVLSGYHASPLPTPSP